MRKVILSLLNGNGKGYRKAVELRWNNEKAVLILSRFYNSGKSDTVIQWRIRESSLCFHKKCK